jgi:predicted acetyltransferase
MQDNNDPSAQSDPTIPPEWKVMQKANTEHILSKQEKSHTTSLLRLNAIWVEFEQRLQAQSMNQCLSIQQADKFELVLFQQSKTAHFNGGGLGT